MKLANICVIAMLFGLTSCSIPQDFAITEANRLLIYSLLTDRKDTCMRRAEYQLCYKQGVLDTAIRKWRSKMMIIAYGGDSLNEIAIMQKRRNGNMQYVWRNYYPNLAW